MPDDVVLPEALKLAAFYVGALGSRRNQEAHKKYYWSVTLKFSD